jgi:hypothetical protein
VPELAARERYLRTSLPAGVDQASRLTAGLRRC